MHIYTRVHHIHTIYTPNTPLNTLYTPHIHLHTPLHDRYRTDTRVETWGGIVRNVSSTLSEAATAAEGERGLPAYASHLEGERRRVSKTIVGRSQMAWLGKTLDASTKRGVRWQVVGQQQV